MSKGNDLIERLRALPEKAGLAGSYKDDCLAAAATIASLSEALAEAEKKATSAEAIIGKFQSLVTNVEYWVAHGQSETATRAMIQARKEGWYEMGWRQHLQTYRYPPRDLSQGGKP